METKAILMKKGTHLFPVNVEDVLHQCHDNVVLHGHKGDQELWHHNVIH